MTINARYSEENLPTCSNHPERNVSRSKRTTTASIPKSWRHALVRDSAICISNGDGTDQHRVIESAEAPCWSPYKTQLAYAKQGDVWACRADGTKQHRLTNRWNWNKGQIEAERAYDAGRDTDISWCPIDNLIDSSHWERFHVSRDSGIPERL